ncbi:dihydrofolate reductase [Arthrobacter sp. UYP6]|uniref:dihydrofolate reductase family protein n=1 Tax=Arthrobacter sp. UYP6 TaxID=1756378 RepID=UPI00339A880E
MISVLGFAYSSILRVGNTRPALCGVRDAAMLGSMGKVIYYVASSLDGYIATEDHNLDWLMAFGFEPFQSHFDQFMAGVGSLVMGSATYDYIRSQDPGSWDYGTLPCQVLTSRDLQAPPDSGVRFSSGDIRRICADAVADAGERNVWVVGGGKVAAQFAEAGVLDELWVTYMPVALGSGRRLLPVTAPIGPMRLAGTTSFNGGAAELRFSLR